MRPRFGERLFRALRMAEEWLIGAAVLAVAALTIANVACRSLLGFSLASAEEISRFLIIAITFLGIGYAAGRGRHIRMTALYDQLGHKPRKALMILIAATTGVLMLMLAWYAAGYVATVKQLGTKSPVLQVPLSLVYAIAPIGLLLAAVQYGLTVFRNLTARDVYLSFDQKDEYEPQRELSPRADSTVSEAVTR